MRVSSSQLARIVAESLQGAKSLDGKLELKAGEIVRATLLDYLGGQGKEALIQIGTARLRAQLDTPLPIGSKVALLVTGEQIGSALELKVVSGTQTGNGSQAALDPSAVLKAVGLEETESTKSLVREWLARGLPLKADTLRAAADVLRQAGSTNTPATLQTLANMAERGVPIHRSTFDALHTLETGPKLHDLLAKVTTALQELGLPESSEETGGTPSGKTGVLTARPTSAETAAPTAQAPASRTGDTAPHFPENKISRPLPTAGDSNSLSPRPNADVLSSATRGQLQQLLTATRQLASGADLKPESLQQAVQKLGLGFEAQLAHAVRRLPAEATPEQVQTALTHALQQQETGDGPALKQMLHQLQAARPDLEAAGLQQLADDIGMLAKHVTGQQLMQGTGQERSDLVYQFAGVPVQMGDRKQTVELHIMSRKSPGQKTLDPANCYILFHLDMPQLGPLDIHLHIVDKVVGVRFLTETGEGVQIEPSEQQTLRASLQGTGYHLGVMKVEAKQQAHDGQHPPLLPPVLTKSGLDFKV